MTTAQQTNPFTVPILPGYTRRDEHGNIVEAIPPEPCPEFLTAEEAIRFLRLTDLKDPMDKLYNLRKDGLLRGTQMGRNIGYLRSELMECLDKSTELKPR